MEEKNSSTESEGAKIQNHRQLRRQQKKHGLLDVDEKTRTLDVDDSTKSSYKIYVHTKILIGASRGSSQFQNS